MLSAPAHLATICLLAVAARAVTLLAGLQTIKRAGSER